MTAPDLRGLAARESGGAAAPVGLVAEARALLSAATPGPWCALREGTCRWAIEAPSAHPGMLQRIGALVHGYDAALISAAPRLLAALCDEATAQRERAERAEREVRVLRIERPDSEYDDLERIAQERADRAATLHAECARLTAVLDSACRERDAALARLPALERVADAARAWAASEDTDDGTEEDLFVAVQALEESRRG